MADTSQLSPGLVSSFVTIVGSANVSADADLISEFSQDLGHWEADTQVGLVVRPGSAQEVAAIVKQAAELDLYIAPRGAGLSYTRGYIPSRERTIALDLSRLTEIHEFNADDLYVTAGTGTTWQRVLEVTKPAGLRPILRGPISGSHSTVGGAASQGIMGLTDGFLSFEVVLANGDIVTTGAGASKKSSPFYRHFGPDLTGLFSGDTGAFGVKTKVTLKLEKPPVGLAMGSFSFPSLTLMVEAIVTISRQTLVPRLFGMDPLKTRMSSKIGVADAVQTLGSILVGRSSFASGVSDAVSVMRSGRSALDSAEWSLHVHAEGVDETAAKETLGRVRDICLRTATEVSPNIAIALNARPHSIRGFVGIEGERFLPIHAILPLSRASEAAARVEQFFEERQKLFENEQITTCCLAAVEQGVFVIEPMFYWPDELGPLHRRYLPRDKLERLSRGTANRAGRSVVLGLREELRQIFFELGAVHGQIGKYYDFAGAVHPPTYELLTRIKGLLDPDCRFNPGNFGWSPATRKN